MPGRTDSLADLMTGSLKRSPYFGKDLAKARRATRFVGQGSPWSSTQAYAEAMAPLANTGSYAPDDVIFVSCEGARRDRFACVVDGVPQGAYTDLDLAVAACATVVMDGPVDRARPYNVGEREVAGYLSGRGYVETSPGTFAPARVTDALTVARTGITPRSAAKYRGGPLPPARP